MPMDLALFLTYFFPPLGGGGVQRSSKFVKYLPENGWQPVVVSVQPNRRNSVEQGLDTTLLADIKPTTTVTRCRPVELSSLYYLLYRFHLRKVLFEFERFVPLLHMDYKIGWYFSAFTAAKKLLSKAPIKLVYSSSPPHSAHLVAYRLKKLYGLPWLADFRDPWTEIAGYHPPTPLHRMLDNTLERRIITSADAIIANTAINKKNLIDKYGLDEGLVWVIPNGFDPADFKTASQPLPASSRFTISCLGKFYDMPDARVFFRAYRRLSERHPDTLLRLIGWHSRTVRKAAQSVLLKGSWETSPRVGHDSAISVMCNSSALLVNLPSEESDHWIPGKIYEYLAAKRPILFVGPLKGDAADIIRATVSGRVVGFNEEHIYEALKTLYDLWRSNFKGWRPNPTEIERYDRRVQAKQLAEIFNQLKHGRYQEACGIDLRHEIYR